VQLNITDIIIASIFGAFLLYVLPPAKPFLTRLEEKFKKKESAEKQKKKKYVPSERAATIGYINFSDIVLIIMAIAAIIVYLLYLSGRLEDPLAFIIITIVAAFILCALVFMVLGKQVFVIRLAEKLAMYYGVYWDRDVLLLITLFITPAFPIILFPESGWAEAITILIFIFLTGVLLKEKSIWLGTGYVAVMLFVMIFIMSLD